MRYPEFAAFRTQAVRDDKVAKPCTAAEPEIQSATPQERLEAADKEMQAELAAALQRRLQALSPNAFEQLIIDVLVKIGYGGSRSDAAERLGRSSDGGIDGVIREDALGLETIYLQAKRYGESNPVGRREIQSFAGALLANGATKGVFVTTSRFTAQARQTGEAYRTPRIILIDGVELGRQMIEHEVGVRTMQTIRIQRVSLEDYENGELE